MCLITYLYSRRRGGGLHACVLAYVSAFVSICVSICVYICGFICIIVYACVCMAQCVYQYVLLYISACIYVCLSVCEHEIIRQTHSPTYIPLRNNLRGRYVIGIWWLSEIKSFSAPLSWNTA